ncbi:hypothetical protein evm_014005 [Chilo suppressalis]|nr:hypothetical protein evm_014005 [Chilo suppressalis]
MTILNFPDELPDENFNKDATVVKIQQDENIKNLAEKCDKLKRKVRRLNEKVRRRDGKIALLTDMLKDLQSKNFINSEETLLLEQCAGSKDFLKRK